jgi:hypothetical protein
VSLCKIFGVEVCTLFGVRCEYGPNLAGSRNEARKLALDRFRLRPRVSAFGRQGGPRVCGTRLRWATPGVCLPWQPLDAETSGDHPSHGRQLRLLGHLLTRPSSVR